MTRDGLENEKSRRFVELESGIKAKVEDLVAAYRVLYPYSSNSFWDREDSACYATTTAVLKRWKERPVIPSIKSIFPFVTRWRLGTYVDIGLELGRDSQGEVNAWVTDLSSLREPVLGLRSTRWNLTLALTNERRSRLLVSDRTPRRPVGLFKMGMLLALDKLFRTNFAADVMLGYERAYPATIETLEVFSTILQEAEPQWQFLDKKRREDRSKLDWRRPYNDNDGIV